MQISFRQFDLRTILKVHRSSTIRAGTNIIGSLLTESSVILSIYKIRSCHNFKEKFWTHAMLT
jgi:hypothetical protein